MSNSQMIKNIHTLAELCYNSLLVLLYTGNEQNSRSIEVSSIYKGTTTDLAQRGVDQKYTKYTYYYSGSSSFYINYIQNRRNGVKAINIIC